MRNFLIFLSITLFFPVFSQVEDLDGLSREIDLSILEKKKAAEGETEEVPANHLLVNLDKLPSPAATPGQITPTDRGEVVRIDLPAAHYLVAPNPARIDQAYTRLTESIRLHKLEVGFPLKVVLHADGNFSVAMPLKKEPETLIPHGVDISPQPEMHFAAVLADIQLLSKEHPAVLNAFLELREAAENEGWELNRKEFYFFPQSPGKVWFALPVKMDNPAGKDSEKE